MVFLRVLLVVGLAEMAQQANHGLVCVPSDDSDVSVTILSSGPSKVNSSKRPGGGGSSGDSRPNSNQPAKPKPEQRLPMVNRNQYEYPADIPCPTQYIDDHYTKSRPGYRLCRKANIGDCPAKSTWYSPSPRCQFCECVGGLANCNKISCSKVPEGTPLPGRGVLARKYKKRLRNGNIGACTGCLMVARHRIYAYCVCDGSVSSAKEFYAI